MSKLLAHSWISAAVGAVLYAAATIVFWQKPADPVRESAAAVVTSDGPSWYFKNPESEELISELKTERKALQQREQQLNDLATRLQVERSEMTQVITSVREMQSNFDESVVRVNQEETANLKKLAKVYAAMEPLTAAEVLAKLDNRAIVKILIYLKDNETAAILEALAKKGEAEARRTAEISDDLRLSTHTFSTK